MRDGLKSVLEKLIEKSENENIVAFRRDDMEWKTKGSNMVVYGRKGYKVAVFYIDRNLVKVREEKESSERWVGYFYEVDNGQVSLERTPDADGPWRS